MKHTKRMIAILILLSILAECAAFGRHTTEAETLSKEAEWNIKCLKAENSYTDSKRLPKIRVAVLDSGLDTDRNIPFAKRKDFLGEEELHSMFQDETGHGTSVAGLICATENDERITGIAANAELYVARILDAANEAPVDRVIEALEWAMQEKVHIIHMSFGTKYYSEELEETIKKAYRQGILIIAAAGNDGNAAEDESTIEYPAAFDEVISVGATDVDNSVMESSSTGDELDVVAPGNRILSTGAFGGVVVDDGTSVSAAQVTGIAAVLWGKHPDKSNEFIRQLLVGSANTEAVHGACGNGLVDYTQTNLNYKQMNSSYRTYKKQGLAEKTAIQRAASELPENTAAVKSHEGKVPYVNGLWSRTRHEEMAVATNAIAESDIAFVKAGARLPDELDSMKQMSKHPCFHGAGNYFANVSYLLAYAKQLIKEGKEQLPEFKGFFRDERDYNKLNLKGNYNIQTELSNSLDKFYAGCINKISSGLPNNTMSAQQKGYAILGLALHTITDTFAHMGYRKEKDTNNFYEIVHNRVGQKGWENSVTQLWHDIANSNTSTEDDKTYYKNKLTYFACADVVDKMKVASILSQKVSNELVAAVNGTDDFLNKMAVILKNYKLENAGEQEDINKAVNYRVEDVNTNWAAVKDNTTFDINIDKNNAKIEIPNKNDIKAKITSKSLTITIEFEPETNSNYTYQIYYKKGNQKVFFKRISTTKNQTVHKIAKSGMKNNQIFIVCFYGSHQRTLKYNIERKIIYHYKKKKKTQVVPFKPKKHSFKLYGNVFKIKKKKFKGWSTKKKAKKVTYKPKKKIKFAKNKNLHLYCVKK